MMQSPLFVWYIVFAKTIAFPKAEVSRLRARPKGFPIALWKPSGPSLCCNIFYAAQYYSSSGSSNQKDEPFPSWLSTP